jgi:hypothetical protein
MGDCLANIRFLLRTPLKRLFTGDLKRGSPL